MASLSDATRRLDDALEVARTARKKGDALRGRRPEPDVQKTYGVGIDAIESALADAAVARAELESLAPPLAGEADALLKALVEACGTLGGLRQRSGLLQAARDSYQQGGDLERRFALPSTYNRLNRVKQDLLLGSATLDALMPEVEGLARTIESALGADQALNDSGWVWADLGDCLALLDRTAEASTAYANFIAKAEIKSPERTLDVLGQIAAKLAERGDPGAERLHAAIDALKGRLGRGS